LTPDQWPVTSGKKLADAQLFTPQQYVKISSWMGRMMPSEFRKGVQFWENPVTTQLS